MLHPLVGSNCSTLKDQSFKTWFQGDEFYLSDYVIAGERILPGVVYLEMARAAGELAQPENKVVEVQDVVWVHPLVVEPTGIEATLRLEPEGDKVRYILYTQQADEEKIHGQGMLIYGQKKELAAWSRIIILKEQLLQKYSKEELYSHFAKAGIHYGKTFQVLEWVQTDGKDVLGFYRCADANQLKAFELAPSILDSALQSKLALYLTKTNTALLLPFALERLQIHSSPPSEGYIHLRASLGRENCFELQILNKQNQVCVELQGLSVRPLAFDPFSINLNYYRPQWQLSSLPIKKQRQEDYPKELRSICVIGENEALAEELKSQLSHLPVLQLRSGNCYYAAENHSYQVRPGVAEDYRRFIQEVRSQGLTFSHFIFGEFNKKDIDCYINITLHETVVFLQTLMQEKVEGDLRIVVPYTIHEMELSSEILLTGLSKSLTQEHPRYQICVMGIDPSLELSVIADKTVKEMIHGKDVHVRHQSDERWVEHYIIEASETQEDQPQTSKEKITSAGLRYQGVYLITGGFGQLGFIIAEYFAKNYKAKLILTGRSVLTEAKQKKLRQLEAYGAEILYLSGDVSNRETVSSWVFESKSSFGELNGIIHSAGIIEDRLFAQKEWDSFKKVLLPKVMGAINLDEQTQDETLDFFVVFSSLASCIGNAGQTDYASANAFLDGFADWRSKLVAQGQRYGKTISINWPYWAEGGMRIDDATEQWMLQQGLAPLTTTLGLEAFTNCLKKSYAQQLIFYGDQVRWHRGSKFFSQEPVAPNNHRFALDNKDDTKMLTTKLLIDLKQIVADFVKLSPKLLDEEKDLGHYGFDSITFTLLSNRIKQIYSFTIAPALFFEYPALKDLAAYCLQQHKDILLNYYQKSVNQSINKSKSLQTRGHLLASAKAAHITTIEIAEKQNSKVEYLPLSIMQEQLYSLCLLNPNTTDYNIGFSLQLKGPLDILAFNQSIQTVIAEEEALRMCFLKRDNKLQAAIYPKIKVDLCIVDLSDLFFEDQDKALKESQKDFYEKCFDLSQPPLFRFQLIKINASHHVFVAIFHHIILDGWSLLLFIQKLAKVYNAFENRTPISWKSSTYQFSNFIEWQKKQLSENILAETLIFWKKDICRHK